MAGGEADRGGGSAGAADELLTSSLTMAVALGPDAGSFQPAEVRPRRSRAQWERMSSVDLVLFHRPTDWALFGPQLAVSLRWV